MTPELIQYLPSALVLIYMHPPQNPNTNKTIQPNPLPTLNTTMKIPT